jgi:hypothetical protein
MVHAKAIRHRLRKPAFEPQLPVMSAPFSDCFAAEADLEAQRVN